MQKDLFLIGIGGTGMRCLEAFIHLCAIGMLDNHNIHILAIDTDFNNGNKSRTESLIDNYIKIKQDGNREQTIHEDSFFSAKINFYKFCPEYTGQAATFRLISKITRGTKEEADQNQDLADLLFDDGTQDFNLSHGYRAQTHLGSHLMYNAILDEVRQISMGKPDSPDSLNRFINELAGAIEPRVFIMGSIFGGTGASSIPILPKAIQDAKRQADGTSGMPEVMYGATLLTNYFRFSKPTTNQLTSEKVIADSDRFPLNCQAALMFYNADNTVNRVYKRMYHLGWPDTTFDYDSEEVKDLQGKRNDKVSTGGLSQKNPGHVVELLSAFAAYDFFKSGKVNPNGKLEHLYRSIAFDNETKTFQFSFEDFVGNDKDRIYHFKNKLSAFIGSCLMLNNDFEGDVKLLVQNLGRRSEINIEQYANISSEDYRAINAFFKSFMYYFQKDKVIPTWFKQIQASSANPNFLKFNSGAYSTNIDSLRSFHWSELWEEKAHQFAQFRLRIMRIPAFDTFSEEFSKQSQQISRKPKDLETLFHTIYQTFTSLHKL